MSECFFHLSQNIYRKIQSAGLTNQYIEDPNFAVQIKMLPSLAFVPEDKVIQSFTALMVEFPTTAIEIAEYFEDTYIGRILPNNTRRIPQFPIRIWNQYTRVIWTSLVPIIMLKGGTMVFNLALVVLTKVFPSSCIFYSLSNLSKKRNYQNGSLVMLYLILKILSPGASAS